MTEQEVKTVIDEMNEYLNKQLWMDFEVIEYSKYALRMIGSLDSSALPDIEIIMKDIFLPLLSLNGRQIRLNRLYFLLREVKQKESI